MLKSQAKTVDEYLESLSPDRRAAISVVRKIILKNLPKGYNEGMHHGVIGYYIPLEKYPGTYNKQPLEYAALASQKNYMSLYLNNVYGDKDIYGWFIKRYQSTGKRMDIGKSCIRFKRIDDLPLGLVAETIAKTPVEEFIRLYEKSRYKT